MTRIHVFRHPILGIFLVFLLTAGFQPDLIAEDPSSLKILSAFPQGTTLSPDQTNAIVVMFNKPMVPLQAVQDDRNEGPIVFEPEIQGIYRWLGTTTLVFTPSEPLPFGTNYRARIPSGTRAYDESSLDQDFLWSFETIRPSVIATVPGHNSVIKTDQPVYVRFNQPIDSILVTRYLRVFEYGPSDRREIEYTYRYPEIEEIEDLRWDVGMVRDSLIDRTSIIVIEPRRPYRKATRYAFEIEAGLPGTGGSLGSAIKEEFSLLTHDTFKFTGSTTGTGHQPDREIFLSFSTPVPINALVKNIDILPAVEIPGYYHTWDYATEIIYLNLSLVPDTTYNIRIKESLEDIYGQRLGSPVSFRFTTGSYMPRLSMVTGQGLLEAYHPPAYTVSLMNIDTVRVRTAVIHPDSIIPVTGSDDFYWQTSDKIRLPETTDSLVIVNPPANRRYHHQLPLQATLGEKSHGTLFLEVQPHDAHLTYRQHMRAVLQVTELGLTAKFSPDNSLLWVTRLRDTQPVPRAEVELRDDDNRVLWTGTTDESGMVRAPGWGEFGIKPANYWSSPRLWFFVRHGSDFAYTRTEDGTGIEPWRFGIRYDWRPRYQPLQGTLFTERGMYRAGESVHLKGVVRKRIDDAWQIPETGDTIFIRVFNARNDIVYADSLVTNEFGSFDRTIPLPQTASTGTYRVTGGTRTDLQDTEEYYRDDDYEVFAYGQFRVEAFRPAEFNVTVRALTPEIIPGDTLRAAISARYLFGAPLIDDSVDWQIIASPASYRPPGYPDYVFGGGSGFWDDTFSMRQRQILANQRTVLDENGQYLLTHLTTPGMLTGTHSLIVEATVQSVSRRTITGRASVLMHGGSYYAGIRRSSAFITAGETLDYALIAVTPEGEPVAGKELTVSIVKREWSSVRKTGVGGQYRWVTERLDSVYESFSVISEENPYETRFRPTNPGLYYITCSGFDNRGNAIRSAAYFYVSGSGYVAWQRTDDDRIELVADAERYVPGETARVIVQSPYERARALVTLERNGIIDQWIQEVEGSAPEIRIPIVEEFLPNVYLSVLLLHGRVPADRHPSEITDVGKPSFKIGYINLPVDAGSRHLTLDIRTDRESYRPGDEVTIGLTVSDTEENPVAAEITISVADAGVLQLINYRLPDPFGVFYGPQSLSVKTSNILSHLVEQRSYGEKGEDEGGGGGIESLADMEVRGNFRFTAYWNPNIVTDSSGKASVTFTLPDNLTEFIVMAVGQTAESSFGYGESAFTVTKDLLLQPALPRFVRIGDRFEGGVTVTNFTDTGGTVTIKSTVEGRITPTGSTTELVLLRPGESREVRFAYESKESGTALFTYTATMNSFRDAVQVEIPVQEPRIKETVALYSATTDRQIEHIIVPDNIHLHPGGIEFTASSTALSGLRESVDYLYHYPYECLEQQLSRILPIILAEEMVTALNLVSAGSGAYRQRAEAVLNELSAFQSPGGGFALWRGEQRANPYITAYALYVMGEAERRGYSVSASVRENAIQFVKNMLRDTIPQFDPLYPQSVTLSAKALGVYALALFGETEHAYIELLYKQRKDLPIFARGFLFKAIVETSGDRIMLETLHTEFMNMAKVSSSTVHFEEYDWEGLVWTYSSDVRTTAVVLYALLAAGRADAISQRTVAWLVARQFNGRWRSTQDNVYAIIALAAYFEQYEPAEPDFRARISLAGQRILEEIFSGYDVAVEREEKRFADLPRQEALPVDISITGEGRLYYGISMTYYPTDISDSRDEGITVLKSIMPLDESEKPDTSYRPGSVYIVTITVITPENRYFVAVDDPLPAGFEPVNLSFATESIEMAMNLPRLDTYRSWRSGFNHTEQYDDRILLFADILEGGVHTYSYLARAMSLGTFTMPPTYVEQMYEQDVFGYTTPKIIRVK
jgi:alpha-2-macroglobulin